MKIYTTFPSSLPPTALTIGSFDGFHLGHQALLKALREKSDHITVLTFINHPSQILNPEVPLPGLLLTFPQKLALLKDAGVDVVIVLPFTKELAATPFDLFLDPFQLTYLLLGEGSAFGQGRKGNEENVKAYAAKKGFTVEYLPKILLEEEPISSRRVRAAVAAGDFEMAAKLLGRPFSLFFPKEKKEISEHSLCLPPDGHYFVKAGNHPVLLEVKGKKLSLSHPFKTETMLEFHRGSHV